MARLVTTQKRVDPVKKVTSIGRSNHTRVTNKSKRRSHKPYRGQGR